MNDEIPLMMEREAGAPEHVPMIAVGFGLVAVEDKKASLKEGHPVFVEREFFKAVVPGDRQTTYCQPVKDRDKARFPRAYAAFKDRSMTPTQGFPIDQWPPIDRATSYTLRAMHIHTVEMLAEVNDSHIMSLGQRGRELREQAKAYLSHSKDTAAATAIAVKNKALEDELAEQRRMVMDLATKLEQALTKRGPGRPPKEQSEAA